MELNIIKGQVLKQFTDKPIVIAAIKFSLLRKIVKFTSREAQNYDPFDPYKSAEAIINDVNNNYYQRLTNDQRVKDIYLFLLKEINNLVTNKSTAIGTFPTSLIISLEINDEFETFSEYSKLLADLNENSDNTYGAALNDSDKENYELLIPHNKISLIVDGQHRMAGMLKLYNDAYVNDIKVGRNSLKDIYPVLNNKIIMDHLNNFSFGCTMLIGFDLWEQGKVFADVNFNQKPVNKSLYYDIFGSLPNPDKNEIFLSHMLAMHLNNNDSSPLKGFIKMLGKGQGYISQAFFVESLLEHFKAKGIWSAVPLDYLRGGDEFKFLPNLLKAYFQSISEAFPNFWPTGNELKPSDYKSILAKTTGIGALMRLLQPLYLNLLRKNFNVKNAPLSEIKEQFDIAFQKIKNNGKEYFSKESKFGGAGSKGLQTQLYNKMLSDIKEKSPNGDY